MLEVKENEKYSLLEKASIQYIMYGEKKKLQEVLNQLFLLKCVSSSNLKFYYQLNINFSSVLQHLFSSHSGIQEYLKKINSLRKSVSAILKPFLLF